MVCRARRPIGSSASPRSALPPLPSPGRPPWSRSRDRKSTRLNSSHGYNSHAVFCLQKKITTRHRRLELGEPDLERLVSARHHPHSFEHSLPRIGITHHHRPLAHTHDGFPLVSHHRE